MDGKYFLTLYNKNIYKEIDLQGDMKRLSIGTYYENDVRMKKELFFEDFALHIIRDESGRWELECSPNIYIDSGDIRKILRVQLKHGDEYGLRYQQDGEDFLRISFSKDFQIQNKKYEDEIQLSQITGISIGGCTGCNVLLHSRYTVGDRILLAWKNGKLWVKVVSSRYGVYINGRLVTKNYALKDRDFITFADYAFYFKGKSLYTDLSHAISLNGLPSVRPDQEPAFVYPLFNRSTRIASIVPDEPIAILDPPELPQKPENNLLMSVMPAVVMLILTIVLRGVMSGNGTSSFVIFSACTIGMGIITSIITFVQGNKGYKKSIQDREESYRAYIGQKCADIRSFRDKEREVLEYNYPDPAVIMGRVQKFSGDLFDRTAQDDDFMDVRVGTGTTEAIRKIDYKQQEKIIAGDKLTLLPAQVKEKYKMLDHRPITIQLKSANAVGVIGVFADLHEFAKNMILDLTGRQYADDLKMALFMNGQQQKELGWVRYLPHVQSDGVYARLIACDSDSRTNLFEYLYKEFSRRMEIVKKNSKGNIFTFITVFVLDSAKIMTHPLSKFIPVASEIQAVFIFFQSRKEKLPLGCSELIYLTGKQGELIHAADNNQKIRFTFESISQKEIEKTALRMAPAYCEEISLEGGLVKNISLFELLNIYSVEDLDLAARWNSSEVYRSMAAPLGVKSNHETVYLDIHEKAHGPHGLVAGTTGSGKSEILQSFILSVATLYHPYEIGFMIIDFKGGGMANQFLELPHLMGTITNIDGKQINRSLLSIKAELLKRQRYFTDADVNHIDKYMMKYKKGEVKMPLPHLIIIVDEFAELKADYPEFMKELISASRIGRSLGVHLILATQKPSGQVSEQIWGNSRFKLCLKVQSPEDSNEMIKSPLAAEILEPGRAYFQVGNNEIFELFQSGFSGAPEKSSLDSLSARQYKISEVTFEGKRNCVFEQKKSKESHEADRTQLEALTAYIKGYCKEKKIRRLASICLPPLPELLLYPSNDTMRQGIHIVADIGLLDDPDNQRQVITSIDFSQENVMVIGSSQYGKTNLLQVLLRGLCTQYSPQDVIIYILDFGSMVLRSFDGLRHVGGVVIPSDDEKYKNFIRLMLEEIEGRKEKMLAAGVSSFISYKEAGYKDLPQIVILIDNFTALKECFLQEEDPIMQICRDGISVGISVVICNTQTAGMGYRYMANFAKRIAFFCNESGEYANVIERCRTAPDNVAGRALTEVNKEIYELQTYLSFEGDREVERVAAIKDFTKRCNQKHTGHAKRIPVIPDALNKEVLRTEYGRDTKDSYVIPAGLFYEPITVFEIDLLSQGWFATAGRNFYSQYSFLQLILDQLYSNLFTCPADVYIVDTLDRKLAQLENIGIVQEYSVDASDLVNYVENIYIELSDRATGMETENNVLKDEALKFVIIRNQEAIEMLCKNAVALKQYKELVGRLRNMKVCFLYFDIPNVSVGYSAPEIMKNIKDMKNLLFFEDLSNLKICDITAAAARKFKKKIAPGDGYWLYESEISKVKIVESGESD